MTYSLPRWSTGGDNDVMSESMSTSAERIKLYHACIKEVQDHGGHFVPFIQAFMDAASSKVSGWTPTVGAMPYGKIVMG